MPQPWPKPPKRVKIKKRLQARREPKAFQHRRVPDYQEFIRGYACLIRSMLRRAPRLGKLLVG